MTSDGYSIFRQKKLCRELFDSGKWLPTDLAQLKGISIDADKIRMIIIITLFPQL